MESLSDARIVESAAATYQATSILKRNEEFKREASKISREHLQLMETSFSRERRMAVVSFYLTITNAISMTLDQWFVA